MIPSPFRFKAANFTRASSRSYRHPNYTLFISPPLHSAPRFCVVVTKSFHARATARNRLRRQLYHGFYQEKDNLPPRDYLLKIYHQPPPSLTHVVRFCQSAL